MQDPVALGVDRGTAFDNDSENENGVTCIKKG